MKKELFGRRLKLLREALGLKQKHIAEELDVVPKTIGRWESGETTPLMSRLPGIYKALGVTEDQFWDTRWFPEARPARTPMQGSRRTTEGPYLNVSTNASHMASECPRCGATDFSENARYCRQCAFPLYNYCVHPDMEQRHVNPPDARFCEVCTRPTFWSMDHVTFELIRGERATRNAHNEEEEHSRA